MLLPTCLSRRPIPGAMAALMLAACLALPPGRAAGQTAAPVRAGVARVEITPTSPVTLAGYASRDALSTGVHDPLSARVVAFEHDGRRLVLVAADLIGFYDGSLEPIRGAILERCGLEPSELFLAATHTHSGPRLATDSADAHPNNIAYTRTLGDRLAGAVREALGRLAPARIGTGAGASPVGVNRRQAVVGGDGATTITLGRNPEAPTDREVQVMVVAPADRDDPAAVLFAYATHSTALGPKNLVISGDVHGLAARFVEGYLGGGAIAPAFAGASGDIDPWFRVRPGFRDDRGWVPEPVLLGTMLGEEVVHVAEGVEPGENTGPIRTLNKTLDLPGKPGEGEGAPGEGGTRLLTLTVGRVGDVAFVGLGGEVFNEIGAAIKAGSPFPRTFLITHCNGSAGYLPTAPSYEQGGYEVRVSPFAPGADDRVVAEAVRLLRAL